MALTGDPSPILTSDRLLSSLGGKSVAFCNVEGAGRAKNSLRQWDYFSRSAMRAGLEPLRVSGNMNGSKRRDLAQ